MIRHNGITLDESAWQIKLDDRVVDFTNLNGLGKVQFRFVKYLLLAGPTGVTREALFDHVYGDDPEGGPLYGHHIFDVMLIQCKKHFASLGVECRRERRAGKMYLRLARVV